LTRRKNALDLEHELGGLRSHAPILFRVPGGHRIGVLAYMLLFADPKENLFSGDHARRRLAADRG
jgi:hypothetical protein